LVCSLSGFGGQYLRNLPARSGCPLTVNGRPGEHPTDLGCDNPCIIADFLRYVLPSVYGRVRSGRVTRHSYKAPIWAPLARSPVVGNLARSPDNSRDTPLTIEASIVRRSRAAKRTAPHRRQVASSVWCLAGSGAFGYRAARRRARAVDGRPRQAARRGAGRGRRWRRAAGRARDPDATCARLVDPDATRAQATTSDERLESPHMGSGSSGTGGRDGNGKPARSPRSSRGVRRATAVSRA
jgi:hypothetical protein